MYHSPETIRAHDSGYHGGYPPASRDGSFGGVATEFVYGHYRPAPMSADRPRHPAFTHDIDPFLGAEQLRQSAMEQSMGFGFGLPDVANNLFSLPGAPVVDDTASFSRLPEQMGRAETLSSSGSHSQSSGASIDDLVVSFPPVQDETP